MIKKEMNDFLSAVCDECGEEIENSEEKTKLSLFHFFLEENGWRVEYEPKLVDKYYHYCSDFINY